MTRSPISWLLLLTADPKQAAAVVDMGTEPPAQDTR
jgi:hypothetical protein